MIIFGNCLLVCGIIFFFFGLIHSEDDRGAVFTALIISSILSFFVLIGGSLISDEYPIFSKEIPKYRLMESVRLPDGSVGEISGVHYLVEGVLYSQDSLSNK